MIAHALNLFKMSSLEDLIKFHYSPNTMYTCSAEELFTTLQDHEYEIFDMRDRIGGKLSLDFHPKTCWVVRLKRSILGTDLGEEMSKLGESRISLVDELTLNL